MEHQTEEGNPLLKLRSSITTHPKHWYIINDTTNQSTVKCLHDTDGGDKKNIKGKGKKVQSARVCVFLMRNKYITK